LRRGTCLLRYVVGDICSLTYQPCPECGNWEPRFSSIPYRTGGIVKVKGTLVNVAALFDVISRIRGIQEYEIILQKTVADDPFSEDLMLIKLACEKGLEPQIAQEVPEAVRRSQEVSPKIEFVAPDYYAGTLKDYKFKRFKDLRVRPA